MLKINGSYCGCLVEWDHPADRWETRPYLAIWRFPTHQGPPEAPEVVGWGDFGKVCTWRIWAIDRNLAKNRTTGRKLQAFFSGKIEGNHLTREIFQRCRSDFPSSKWSDSMSKNCFIGRIDYLKINHLLLLESILVYFIKIRLDYLKIDY